MELTQVLQSPVITEKSATAHAAHKFTFLVHPSANKIEVKKAVEAAYGVKVESVNVIPVGKKVRLVGRGRTMTKRQAAKKAIVTLHGEKSIDFNKFQS
ncbi:50S ribosomal protein L23 [Candidatus Peregrinibacteria bacterium]|nr:MAG: 50S ribosomal protein L23 [Candidatus Peregrinibacteria bacterium]